MDRFSIFAISFVLLAPPAVAWVKKRGGRFWTNRIRERGLYYRVDGHLADLGFVCFLPWYCFVCPILPGQVGVWQNGQITLAAKVETTKSQSIKNSLRGDRPPCILEPFPYQRAIFFVLPNPPKFSALKVGCTGRRKTKVKLKGRRKGKIEI